MSKIFEPTVVRGLIGQWKHRKLLPLFMMCALAVTSVSAGTAAAALGGTGTPGGTPLAVTSGPSHIRTINATLPKSALSPDAVTPLAASVSFRFFWGAFNGCVRLNLSGVPVTAGQAVVASATESDGAAQEFIGNATITTNNVAVVNNGVSVLVCVNWSSPLNVWVHYLA